MVRLTLARPRRRSFPLENSAARFAGHVPISRVLSHSSSSSFFFHNQRERRRYLVMQRRVVTIMASSTSALSRRAVAAVVREETREARSCASAVKGHPAPVAPTPAPRTRRRPPPAATGHTPAVHARIRYGPPVSSRRKNFPFHVSLTKHVCFVPSFFSKNFKYGKSSHCLHDAHKGSPSLLYETF